MRLFFEIRGGIHGTRVTRGIVEQIRVTVSLGHDVTERRKSFCHGIVTAYLGDSLRGVTKIHTGAGRNSRTIITIIIYIGRFTPAHGVSYQGEIHAWFMVLNHL